MEIPGTLAEGHHFERELYLELPVTQSCQRPVGSPLFIKINDTPNAAPHFSEQPTY